MALVRVFLLTYRRPKLLPRALASLQAQTFTDWVCELHNDDPDDDIPRQLIAKLADPRITLHHHPHNWGPIASFNHAFAGGPEPFAALLEDDNWWEPDLLAAAVPVLKNAPTANVVWANLRLWRETPAGDWSDTGRTVWQTAPGDTSPRHFRWPLPLQCYDGLHSNGAMLYRASASRLALVPAETPFDIIEPVRERLLPGDWILLPQPLGHFALTLTTARAPKRAAWQQSQLLVSASHQLAVRSTAAELDRIWETLRTQRPQSTSLIFMLAFSGVRPAALLRHARLSDGLRFIAGMIRRPGDFVKALRFRSTHRTLWPLLLDAARLRTHENQSAPSQPPVFTKRLKQCPGPPASPF